MQDINDKINNMHMGKLIHMLSHEMKRNGYLTRESVKGDARKKRLVPTEKAEGLRQAILEDIKLSEKRMEKGIPEEDVITCTLVLYQVLQNLIEKHKEEGKKDE